MRRLFGNNERCEALLNILWEKKEAMSAQEILEESPEKMVNITYVHRTLNELLKKGLIKESGIKRYNTQYARLFSCAYSKEEYAAKIMKNMGLPATAIGKVALALINDKSDDSIRQDLIDELNAIIEGLKG